MNSKTKRNFEQEIVDCLIDNNYGITVLGIADKIGASRNTVYRYLGILEGKNQIFKREIGTYKLYYSKEARLISREIVLSYYKGLLNALNDEIQLNPIRFKVLGRKIANYLDIPFEVEDYQNLININKSLKSNELEFLSSLQPYFTLLHDKITLKKIINEKDRKKFIVHFVDSDLLEEEIPYIYHFYILSGIIEGKFAQLFNLKVKCDVLDYKTMKENGENYIKISLELS
ncbi:MAG: hypothetical protein ACFFAO_06825 [Candidatus Hermodarchaeota archaeon]